MKLFGTAPINPMLFYTGKVVGFGLWIVLFLAMAGFDMVTITNYLVCRYLAYLLVSVGVVLVIVSLLNLGRSTSMGVPTEKTVFKNSGLYRFSRNPMYLGFNMFTLAAVLFFMNIWVLALSVFCVYVYHQIIMGEERFLTNRFGSVYTNYKRVTRRYL